MSHHLSGPNLRPPSGDARLDLTDVFAFESPTTPQSTVLIMNVNSFAFDPTHGPHPHPDAVYRLNIDNDGDARADVAFSFVFSAPRDGRQTVTVFHGTDDEARSWEAAGEEVLTDVPVSFGPEPEIAETGWLRFSAGLRSDPFFADLDGIGKGFEWTGIDTMADKNVIGIVLEVPDWVLGSAPRIGVWARVCLREGDGLVSVDRGAHPSLTAYFNAEDAKDAYNRGEPADDVATYLDSWVAALRHSGDYDAEAARDRLAAVLPDILRFDRSEPAAYPNGRRLDDDVTDVRIGMVTNGRVPDDGIGPHADLLPSFPYLGSPHPTT
ncbi:DUF4331 family protein [Nonomuraea sp. bgisy101]|uniref:DUF4331 family protein n=1 Tax=Nonomuraea sp. bgisy101 TaxID=3413784 RepID=UPI003D7520C6